MRYSTFYPRVSVHSLLSALYSTHRSTQFFYSLDTIIYSSQSICSTCCALHTNIPFSMFILFTLFCIANYQYAHHLFPIYHTPYASPLFSLFHVPNAILHTYWTSCCSPHPTYTVPFPTPSAHYAHLHSQCTRCPLHSDVHLAILHAWCTSCHSPCLMFVFHIRSTPRHSALRSLNTTPSAFRSPDLLYFTIFLHSSYCIELLLHPPSFTITFHVSRFISEAMFHRLHSSFSRTHTSSPTLLSVCYHLLSSLFLLNSFSAWNNSTFSVS